MGKRTKMREAQRFAAEQALAARLRLHDRVERRPAFIATYSEFSPDYLAKINAYRRYALRPPETWHSKLRVRSPDLRFLELVRFTFARFDAPAYLEHEWLEPLRKSIRSELDFRLCYIVLVQGGSVYRHLTWSLLSRTETHHFLSAPAKLQNPRQALWYAVARAQTEDVKLAVRISRTKIAGCPIASPFWKDVARFFTRHQASSLEMNDLIDFLQASRAADPGFSMRGRTLPALRERMAEWHALLRAGEYGANQRWPGLYLPNATYERDSAIWRFKQIRNSMRLFEEGSRMHHCVMDYKTICASGKVSIWSLSREERGRLRHCLTVEVDIQSRIVSQCRGFANRAPSDQERAIVLLWALEHGLRWPNASL